MDQFLEKRHLVLDGALGTQLESIIPNDSEIQPKNDPLWSTKVLMTQPKLIERIHYQYLQSGSDIIMTSTYQASCAGLIKYANSYTDEVAHVWERSVDMANNAIRRHKLENNTKPIRNRDPIICGSVGPYGAFLANGAEYTGEYGMISNEELEKHHFKLLQFLILHPDVKLIAIETIPNFREFKVLVNLLTKLLSLHGPNQKFYLSINVRNESEMCDGTPVEKVMNYLNFKMKTMGILQRNIFAIGYNCVDYHLVTSLIDNLTMFNEFHIPMIVYPNLGYVYSTKHEEYIAYQDTNELELMILDWLKRGVKIIGGCCGSGPQEIEKISEVVNNYT